MKRMVCVTAVLGVVTGSANIKIKRKLIKHNNIKPLSYLIYNDGRVYSPLSHKFLTLKPDKERKKNWTNVSAQYDFGSTGTK